VFPILSGVYGLSKAEYHGNQEDSLPMSDPSLRQLFTELLAIQWPDEPDAPPWRRLGLPQSSNDASQVRQHTQRLLEKLQAARGKYSLGILQEAAREIKLAARLALQDSTPTPNSPSIPTDTPAKLPPAAAQAAPPTIAKLVAQPISKPIAQPVAQPTVPAPTPTVGQVGSDIVVTTSTRARSKRKRSTWLGWTLAASLLAVTAGATAWWLNQDTPWLVLAPPPTQPPTRDTSGHQPSSRPAPPASENPASVAPNKTNESSQVTPAPAPTPNAPHTTSPAEDALNQNPEPLNESPNLPQNIDLPDVPADDATWLVVARQFELARVFLAAGRLTDAQTAWEAGRQLAASDPRYRTADTMLEQLFAWRAEIYQTATQRLPLLNRVGEIPVDDTFVSVISASADELVVRAAGQRREFSPANLPWNLVRGILEVTSGPNAGQDRLRQVVTDALRIHQATDEQITQWREEISAHSTLTEHRDQAYSTAKLELLLRYLEIRKRISTLIVDRPTLEPIEAATWEPLSQHALEVLQSNRSLLTAYRDANRSRFEIEAELWSHLTNTDPDSVATLLWTLHWVAVERADLPFLIDNLRSLQQLVVLNSASSVWRDSARMLGQRAKGDTQLDEWLQLIQAQADAEGNLQAATVTGLQTMARQWVPQIKDRAQRQVWAREFN